MHLFRRADLKLLVPPVGTSVCCSVSQVFIACQLCLYPAALKVSSWAQGDAGGC